MATSGTNDLHFVLFSVMAQGHMIPMVDIARMLAYRGVNVTIVTTPLLASRFKSVIARANEAKAPEFSYLTPTSHSPQVGLAKRVMKTLAMDLKAFLIGRSEPFRLASKESLLKMHVAAVVEIRKLLPLAASPLEEGGDYTDFVTGPSLQTVGPSARSVASVMTTATTVTAFVSNAATTTATPVDVGKDKDVPTPSIFAGSSSSDKTDRTLSLFTGRSGSDFVAGSIRAGRDANVDLQDIYIPEWSVTKGFELNDGRSCANMIDHFTPPAFFKTVRGMEHEQLFAEFNVSAARNLSLSSEAKDESMEVAQLRTRVSSLEAIEGSLQGEIASAKEHNGLLEQERSALKLKVTGLESIIAEKDRELSDLGISLFFGCSNQSIMNQVHELETSSAGLHEKLETYEGSMKQLEEFQDNLMKPLKARLAEIDADFTRCYFTLLQELSAKKDASTWDVMDLFCLDDVVAEVLGMTDLQPDALITMALSTMVIRPNSNPFLLVEDYKNLDLAGTILEDVILGPEGEVKVRGSTEGDVDVGHLVLSQLENEAKDAVL
ncbi:hypothetical protein Tco_0968464 [Tanacetum coccineum]